MTPKDTALEILRETHAHVHNTMFTRRQPRETPGGHIERERQMIMDAIDWVRSMPISVTLENTPVDHDGDCNLLNGADGAGCNCTARERQKMQDRISELEKTIRWNKTKDWADESAKYHKGLWIEAQDRIAELEDSNRRMHGMIMSIRDHVGAYDTPTVPTDVDIIKCVTNKYDDLKRALDDLGVTPEEARKGAERSRQKGKRISELQQLHGPTIRLTELVPAAYFRGWADGAKTGESDSPDWNAEEDWRETDIRRELLEMEDQTPSMTVYDLTQLVCGELPEGFEMGIHLENGYGGVKLEMDDGGEVEGDELADSSLETQIVELVKLAKGEPSEYTYDGWPSREQP